MSDFARAPTRSLLLLFLLLACSLFVAAYALPLTQDEAYYFGWGTRPQAGYFDHPPGVAWLSMLSQMLPGASLFKARAATVVVALLSFWGLVGLYRLCGFTSKSRYLVAVALACGNLAALMAGLLTTPDSLLLFFWVMGLKEAALALKGQPKRWLSAGLFTGLGLLSKYTMLLIGPVFLWGLWQGARKQLTSPWPYLGGLLALAVFAPNLWWNWQNEGVTWKFQWRHGLAQERAQLAIKEAYPLAQAPHKESPEMRLYAYFKPALSEREEQASERKPPTAFDAILLWLKDLTAGEHIAKRLADFWGGQLALWGGLLFSLAAAYFRHRRRSRWQKDQKALDPCIQPLLQAAWGVPLLVFTLFALQAKVEANWAAVYVVGAAPLLSRWLRPALKSVLSGLLINLAVVAGLITYTRHPFLAVNPGLDRLLRETHGYSMLADFVASQAETPAVFADTYQLVAMLRYYKPSLKVAQWPGITRSSEFLRDPSWSPLSFPELLTRGSFLLLSSSSPPPYLAGFVAHDMLELSDCREGFLRVKTSWLELEERTCRGIHRWFMVEYRRSKEGF